MREGNRIVEERAKRTLIPGWFQGKLRPRLSCAGFPSENAQKKPPPGTGGGFLNGGPYQVRTGDLLNAIEALFQLS